MSTKEVQQEIVSNMRKWQKIEDASVSSTSQIMEKTDNSLVRLIMEIIQRDSQMHHRVQEWIANSLVETVSLTPEELGGIWDMIERHIEVEKKSVAIAEKALASLKGKTMVIQAYLLNYLLEDEKKHDKLLADLDSIKKKMYPYG